MAKEMEIEKNINSANIIQEGTSIVGNIESDGNVRIDGSIKGNVKAKGKIIVGQSGVIEGDLLCANATIEGKCKSTIIVNDLLELKSTAIFEGDINTSRLFIEIGAIFVGACKMKLEQKKNDNRY